MSFNQINKTNYILDIVAERQQVIGANLANVNTPGYQRKDIDFGQYLGTLNCPLETTMSKKLGPSPFVENEGGEVSAAQELIAMQKNNLYYAMATRRMSSMITEIKTVLNVGK